MLTELTEFSAAIFFLVLVKQCRELEMCGCHVLEVIKENKVEPGKACERS